LQVQGAILVDQIRCLDWNVCSICFVEAVADAVIEEVQAKIYSLIL